MVYILKKKYKEHSHTPIEEIKKQQIKYKKELTQPRDRDGELSQDFLHLYGTKNVRITEHDIRKMERKNSRYARQLAKNFEAQQKRQ